MSVKTGAKKKSLAEKPEPGKMVALNFRVTAELKRDFKIMAATHEITQSRLLTDAFNEWRARRR